MSALDPRTPVLVGAAALRQRVDDPADGLEAAGLMARVARDAASDAGAPALLDALDLVLVPEGTWRYPDPGRLVGAPAAARTVLAQVGVLQQTLLTRACLAIARGEADVVLVVGGEAKQRERQLALAGLDVPDTSQPGARADEVLAPEGDILHRIEIERELAWPVRQYAVIESALGAADGMTPDEQRGVVDRMWASVASVSATNPWAWSPGVVMPDDLRPSVANPMMAAPYTRRHTSNWNVDQAAGLLLCSAAVAAGVGVSRDRWVFPIAAVESNHMLPLVARASIGSCPAMTVVGERAAALAGVAPGEADHVDLYSCFPVAVRLQARAFGLSLDDPARPLTVTGGMAGAGGPLNNYALGALAAVVDVLRADPGSVGLVTSVSGMLTKFGLGLWSTDPPETSSVGFVSDDVSAAVSTATPARPVDASLEGDATVMGVTVVHERGEPHQTVVIAESDAGTRTVACSPEAWPLVIGDRVRIAAGIVRPV